MLWLFFGLSTLGMGLLRPWAMFFRQTGNPPRSCRFFGGFDLHEKKIAFGELAEKLPTMAFLLKNPKLVSFWRYANIVVYKTYANLKSENEKTYLGCIWWIVEPIINTAVFYIVFTQILKNRQPNFTVFLYIGMVAYGYFSTAILTGANAIVLNAGIMQQIYMPKIVFVVISMCNLTWKFLFSLVVLFPLLWLAHMSISWTYLALPLILFLQFWMVLGISMVLSTIIPYFPDGRTVLNTFVSTFIWFSGVFYTIKSVPKQLQTIFYINPAAVIIEAYRSVLIHNEWPTWSHFAFFFPVGIFFWMIGWYILQKIDRKVTKINM